MRALECKNSLCVMKVKVALAIEVGFLRFVLEMHHRPNWMFSDRFEKENVSWDPKDSELCLHRVKPDESLVEARGDTDVQIVRQMWV